MSLVEQWQKDIGLKVMALNNAYNSAKKDQVIEHAHEIMMMLCSECPKPKEVKAEKTAKRNFL